MHSKPLEARGEEDSSADGYFEEPASPLNPECTAEALALTVELLEYITDAAQRLATPLPMPPPETLTCASDKASDHILELKATIAQWQQVSDSRRKLTGLQRIIFVGVLSFNSMSQGY